MNTTDTAAPDDEPHEGDEGEDVGRLLDDLVPGPLTFGPRTERAQPKFGPELQAGQRIGDYRLVRKVGQGGMGQVWQAQQLTLGERDVALKFVRPERATPLQLEYFEREARAGGKLSHPGLVAVHDYGEADELAYIAMEFVDGAWSLRDFLDEARDSDQLPSNYDQEVARFVIEIADAMQAAHDAGVIHRDLKPQNVLVTKGGRAKVTDFGLARIEGEVGLSRTGDVAGTFHYMSPEQIAAQRSGVDHRTDVFSLGIVLYELLTQQRPFQGDTTTQIAYQITRREAPDPRTIRSRVPRDLAVIALKALEKRRDDRYGSMADLAADLRRFRRHEPIVAKPPSWFGKAVRWARRHPTMSSLAAAGLVVLVGGSIGFGQYQVQAKANERYRAVAHQEELAQLVSEVTKRQVSGSKSGERLSWSAAYDPIPAEEAIRSLVDGLDAVGFPIRDGVGDFDWESAHADATVRRALALLLDAFVIELQLIPTGEALDEIDGGLVTLVGPLVTVLSSAPPEWKRALELRAEAERGEELPELEELGELETLDPLVLDWLGRLYIYAKHYSSAIALFDQALKKDPTLFWSHYGRSWASRWTGDRVGWRMHAWPLVALDPDSGLAWTMLGNSHHWHHKPLEGWRDLKMSEYCYRKAIELEPDRALTYNGLADLTRDRDKKIAILEGGRRLKKPDSWIYINLLANIPDEDIDYNDEVFHEGLERFPEEPRILHNYAENCVDSGRVGLGLECFLRAVTSQPNQWESWHGAAETALVLAKEATGERRRTHLSDARIFAQAGRALHAGHAGLMAELAAASLADALDPEAVEQVLDMLFEFLDGKVAEGRLREVLLDFRDGTLANGLFEPERQLWLLCRTNDLLQCS